MTLPPPLRTHEHSKLKLLRMLRELNAQGKRPNMTELIRAEDPRDVIPLNTIIARRHQIRAMVGRGLIYRTSAGNGHPSKLLITDLGTTTLDAIEKHLRKPE